MSNCSKNLVPLLGLWFAAASAAAQTSTAWIDVHESTAWPKRTIEDVLPFPGGGVVTSWTGEGWGPEPDGEVVLRRLTENGDPIWEVSLPLQGDCYFLYPYREYRAGTAVSDAGDVAVAIGTSGSMWIHLYAPDGSLRWTTSIDPIVGPHFDLQTDLAVAPNGDVVIATSEGLFAAVDPQHFGLYRFAAANGALLWSHTGPTLNYTHMAMDDLGHVTLAIDRGGPGDAGLERYDPAGSLTGSSTLPGSLWISALAMDGLGRTVLTWSNGASAFLSSIDPSLALEWTTTITAGGIYLTLMSDGGVLSHPSGFSGTMRRYDRQGQLVHSVTPEGALGHFYHFAGARSNGNSILTSSKRNTSSHTTIINAEERDPQGVLVRSFERASPLGFSMTPRQVTVDSRDNVLLIYNGEEFSFGKTEKLLFSDAQGTPYCGAAVPNSTGHPATARAVGSPRIGLNNLSLLFTDLPAGSFVLPIASQTMGLVIQAGGSQGTLCLGGSVGRFDEPGEIRSADAMGCASVQLELQRFPTPMGLVNVMAGESWSFQAWYRDANPTLTSNFTDAVTVAFF